MGEYKIRREFFPFSCFTPPISEKFLAMAVPHMKTPKFIYRDKELDVTRHEVESYDGEKIECFVMSPKALTESAPCLSFRRLSGRRFARQKVSGRRTVCSPVR